LARGAKPGERRGGRSKGTPNKATKIREELIAASNLTPLQYMLMVLESPEASDADRKWAAQNAAPYVHPRLSSIEANVKGTLDIRSKLLEMK